MLVLNGKQIALNFYKKFKKQLSNNNNELGLAAILIGEDEASKLYVKLKQQACEYCGINFHKYLFTKKENEEDIIKTIEFLNQDPETQGILVQLPLPKKFNTKKIIQAIDPQKDIDGFHPENLKLLKDGKPNIISPLGLGVYELLKETKTELKNKKITILCNDEIITEPFKYLLGKYNQIQILHKDSKNLKTKLQQADILIVAIGKPKFVTLDMIKKDAIVIDIGINKLKNETVGDVDFDNVMYKTSFITPVPGGVGPMTIAMLLQNLIKTSELK